MGHELNYTVTQDVVTAATRRFWLQFIGWAGLARWGVASAAIVVLSLIFHQVWFYGLAVFAIVFVPLIWVFGYVTFLRRALYRYGKMQSKLISFRFSDEGLGTKSDLGSAEISWRMLDKVQRYPDVWMLFFGKRDYVYFPAAKISEPLEAYILQQAEKHGIKAT